MPKKYDPEMKARTMTIRATLARVDGRLVSSEPKTASSRRKLPLSEPVLQLLRSLAVEQRRQREQQTLLNAATPLGPPAHPS